MKLHEKLIGIPHIYYINLDSKPERKKYMEDQFHRLGIENFTRVNASNFPKENFDSWKHLVHGSEHFPAGRYRSLAVSLSHLDTLRTWLETTDEENVILMEDDTDMSLVDHWHFDWNYLMNNIPYDWDAIQLMYNSYLRMYCFLHPKTCITWNGPILVSRSYAEKMLDLFYFNGKYNFIKKTNKGQNFFVFKERSKTTNHRYSVVDVDEWLGFNGKVYQLPLFTQNPYFDDPPRDHHIISNKIHKRWWTELKDNFTLEDFFTYGKPYDNKMIFVVTPQKKYGRY